MIDYGLAALAGALTLLSPCVLPILPIVVAGAAQGGRYGPILLASGLAISFALSGIVLNSVGIAFGITPKVWRSFGSGLLILVALTILIPPMERAFARLTQPLADRAGGVAAGFGERSVAFQFVIGLLMGAIWLPCAGPTLGAATALAAKQTDFVQAAIIMSIFAVGAVIPLMVVGIMGREFLARRGLIAAWTGPFKKALGGVLLVVGLMAISGVDKEIEAYLVEASPQWLNDLTTRF